MTSIQQTIALRGQGFTCLQISKRLGVSLKTIEARLAAPKQRVITPHKYGNQPVETIFVKQVYLMSDGTFARVLEVSEALEYITVSLHKSPLDDVVLLDGSNTEEFTRSQIKHWRLWDSVNCKTFSNQGLYD